MSTLIEKANQILSEKTEKIIPENIKSGVTVFNVTGTLSAGASKPELTGINLPDTVEYDPTDISHIFTYDMSGVATAEGEDRPYINLLPASKSKDTEDIEGNWNVNNGITLSQNSPAFITEDLSLDIVDSMFSSNAFRIKVYCMKDNCDLYSKKIPVNITTPVTVRLDIQPLCSDSSPIYNLGADNTGLLKYVKLYNKATNEEIALKQYVNQNDYQQRLYAKLGSGEYTAKFIVDNTELCSEDITISQDEIGTTYIKEQTLTPTKPLYGVNDLSAHYSDAEGNFRTITWGKATVKFNNDTNTDAIRNIYTDELYVSEYTTGNATDLILHASNEITNITTSCNIYGFTTSGEVSMEVSSSDWISQLNLPILTPTIDFGEKSFYCVKATRLGKSLDIDALKFKIYSLDDTLTIKTEITDMYIEDVKGKYTNFVISLPKGANCLEFEYIGKDGEKKIESSSFTLAQAIETYVLSFDQ